MDFCGPLPSGDYMMVIIDEYTRYPVVEIVKSVSANTVIPVLDKVLSVFGYPKIIKSDNGSPFNSYAFVKFAEYSGFCHRHITPRWPRANAQAEAFNKPLMKAIRAAHVENRNWKQEMYKHLRQYRATPHPSTGMSPFELMFGDKPRTRLPQIDTVHPQPEVDRQVRANDQIAKHKHKWYADKRNNAHFRDMNVGDSVLVREDIKQGKLSTPFKQNPYVVVDKKGSMITATAGDGNVTRNSSRFKKVPFEPTRYAIVKEEEEEWLRQEGRNIPTYSNDNMPQNEPDIMGERNSVVPTPSPVAAKPASPMIERPARVRRPPEYLKDYEVK
jgi:hypothetical protein